MWCRLVTLILFAGCSSAAVAPMQQQETMPEDEKAECQIGALSSEELEEIQRTQRIGRGALNACYEDELEERGNKTLHGTVIVQILIGTTGSAKQVAITGGTLKVPKVLDCIRQAIKEWEYPKIKSTFEFSTTFQFSPAY